MDCCRQHVSGIFSKIACVVVCAAIVANIVDQIRENRIPFEGCKIDEELRLIRTSVETINTLSTPSFLPNPQNCANLSARRQFYIQSNGLLSHSQRIDLEHSLGTRLGRYIPNNAYIVLLNCSQITKALESRHLVWVGLRPQNHKLDAALLDNDTSLFLSHWTAIFVSIVEGIETRDASAISLAFQRQMQAEIGVSSHVRVASTSKLTFEVLSNQVIAASFWVADQPETIWIEPKTAFMTRNYASARIIASGISENSRLSPVVYTKRFGLNGSRQVIGLADTGLDWDHCMLWNRPFPFPCYDAQQNGIYDPRASLESWPCKPSSFAGLVANPDFLAFVRVMMNTSNGTNQTEDRTLLDCGTTVGVESVYAPLNILFRTRAARSDQGLVFIPGNDTTFPDLLQAWSEFRPKLLYVVQQMQAIADCSTCGGTVVDLGGISTFVPFRAYKYTWNAPDETGTILQKQSAPEFLKLSKELFQKCMCFFTTPSNATVDPTLPWMGPVPPILELLDLAYSPYAQVTRKFSGLPALPPELLVRMCNISKQRNIDLCQANITFDWGGSTERIEPCSMTWDPRSLEVAVASCVSQVYLPRTILAETSITTATSIQRAQYYVYNTTLSWWGEYTRVPPFNRVDKSRESLVSYYTNDECTSCGICNKVLLDSRNYAGASVSRRLPAELSPGSLLKMSITPLETDWRVDSFQFRNTMLSMLIYLDVKFVAAGGTVFQPRNESNATDLSICVMPVQEINFNWNLSSVLKSRCQLLNVIKPRIRNPPQKIDSQKVNITVNSLVNSANGWQVLALYNNDLYSLTLDFVVQVTSGSTPCSDKKDGDAVSLDNTHSLNLTNTRIASLEPDNQCSALNIPYCDNSFTSGRQLDLCAVCGGACFPPACSPSSCAGSNGITGIRYPGEFAAQNGIVERVFLLPQRLNVATVCSKPSVPGIPCRPYECNVVSGCTSRIETYRVDTRIVSIGAGESFIIDKNTFIIDSPNSGAGRLTLTISLFWPKLSGPNTLPESHLGILVLPESFIDFLNSSENRDSLQIYNGTNATFTDTRIQIIGNINNIFNLIAGTSFTVPEDAGVDLVGRQIGLRLQLSILSSNDQLYSVQSEPGETSPFVSDCPKNVCPCLYGFSGERCDMMPNPTEIIFNVQPKDSGKRVLSKTSNKIFGRRALLTRGGHGTHTATSMVGTATFSSEEISSDNAEIRLQEPFSNGAQLAFVDIGTEASPYLTPPESLGDALLNRPYVEAGARIFVAPWNCEDFVWWNGNSKVVSTGGNATTTMEDDSNSIPTSINMTSRASLCNRYSSSAWEIDEYVERHPDLLVIFPAGDNGASGSETISSPGTCKNCLTVGSTQSWPSSLLSASDHLLGTCRPDDCPQEVDRSKSCGGANQTSPYTTPECCTAKYVSKYYGPQNLHFSSSRGFAISEQGNKQVYGNLFQAKFHRLKPDLVAPGTLIVSGRSDGNPNSGGTNGCRCCGKKFKDKSCMMAMSGTSMASAQLGAAAALVRQYFTDGWYPLGYTDGVADGFLPSAALMRAALITSTESISAAAIVDGTSFPISGGGPNAFSGFGRVDLMNVLRLELPNNEVCACSGDNSLLFTPKNDPEGRNAEIFGRDYGTSCAPWHNMPDQRKQRCNTMFPSSDEEIQRPVPQGFDPTQQDVSCCFSFCFVKSSCLVELSGTTQWASFPDLFYSFSTCPNQGGPNLMNCPWADPTKNYDVKTSVKDHSASDSNSTVDAKIPSENSLAGIRWLNSDSPLGGAIAQNETVLYNGSVYGSSSRVPFIVTLAYTDPVGALGSADVMVNDLNLRVLVTPLDGTLNENSTLQDAAKIPRKRDAVKQLWGNGVVGGDPFNNVEQVRMEALGPSEVVIFVEATRVVQGLSMGSPCQPFSLVWTGDLVGFPSVFSISTIPELLKPGICGRPLALTAPTPSLFSPLILGLIISGVVVGAIILIFTIYMIRRSRAKKWQAKSDDPAKPDQLGYLTRLNEVHREEGIARGGGSDYILLSMESSDVENFYQGLPIAITEGSGAGELSVITGYDRSLRKAFVKFNTAHPSKGSKYLISHEHGAGMGYKIGSLGYVPVPTQQKRRDGFQNPFYSRQITALSHARSIHGQLTENELAAAGIGKGQPTRSDAQDMNALNAGMYVGRPFKSGEIFQYSINQAEKDNTEYDPLGELRKRERQGYFKDVAAIARMDQGEETYLRGLNGEKLEIAPVLKRNVLPSGIVKISDPNGFRFMSQSREAKGGAPTTEEELHV